MHKKFDASFKIRKKELSYTQSRRGIKQEFLVQQSYKCAICKKKLGLSGHLDHDHETGRLRGMLCPLCNAGLGMFKDSCLILDNAIAYIRRASQWQLNQGKK